MANATLLEFLKQYTEDIPASVQQGVIQNIFYDEKYFKRVTFEAVFPAVVPMKDTIYESADGVGIDGLPDRAHLFAGQAPELFLLHPYVEANRRLLPEEILSVSGSTQPAILAGMKIRMIPGEEKNTKITTPEDLQRLEGFF